MGGGNGGFEMVARWVLKKKRVRGSCGRHGCGDFTEIEEEIEEENEEDEELSLVFV